VAPVVAAVILNIVKSTPIHPGFEIVFLFFAAVAAVVVVVVLVDPINPSLLPPPPPPPPILPLAPQTMMITV